METPQLFNFNGLSVRVLKDENGDPWFVGKDVAAILGYSQTQAMTKRLDAEDFKSSKMDDTNQLSTIINESGIYSATLGSHKTEALKFKRWVTREVLPAIRKHGAYLTSQKTEDLLQNPDLIIELATSLKKSRKRADDLESITIAQAKQIEEDAPKVEYYDEVLKSEKIFRTSVLSAELGFSGPNMLHKYLQSKGVIKKIQGVWLLTSEYEGNDYTGPQKHPYVDSDGVQCVSISTGWTMKGFEFVREFVKRNPEEQIKVIKPRKEGAREWRYLDQLKD